MQEHVRMQVDQAGHQRRAGQGDALCVGGTSTVPSGPTLTIAPSRTTHHPTRMRRAFAGPHAIRLQHVRRLRRHPPRTRRRPATRGMHRAGDASSEIQQVERVAAAVAGRAHRGVDAAEAVRSYRRIAASCRAAFRGSSGLKPNVRAASSAAVHHHRAGAEAAQRRAGNTSCATRTCPRRRLRAARRRRRLRTTPSRSTTK